MPSSPSRSHVLRILTTALREVTLGNSSGKGSCVQIMCDTLQSLTRSDPADPGLLVYEVRGLLATAFSPALNKDAVRQVLGAGALGRPRGMGWGGRWEGGSGWGTHVNPWLIYVDVWQNHYNTVK